MDDQPDRYRFRVLTRNGQQLESSVYEFPPTSIRNPQWVAGENKGPVEHDHGATATMRVEAPRHEGKQISFIVEERHGKTWVPFQTVKADVRDGVAIATVKTHHPAAPGRGGPPPPAHPAQNPAVLRFRAEVEEGGGGTQTE